MKMELTLYNNEITYHNKWNTVWNEMARDHLEERYLKHTECSSHIPVAWAEEVLDLLNKIEDQWGIKANDSIYIEGWGYYSLRNYVSSLAISTGLKKLPFRWYGDNVTNKDRKRQRKQRFPGWPWRAIQNEVEHRIKCYKATRYNKKRKPQVTISQVKEKFGHFNLYYDAPKEIKVEIDKLIDETIKKLSDKGAYYTIESH